MRLFVGLSVPQPLHRRLSALSGGLPGARWVTPENYHITLRFIGETDRHSLRDLETSLEDVRAPAFDLSFAGVGSFGSKGRVRAVWAGFEPSDGLQFLQSKVERACIRAGATPDPRKFKAHTTLARFRDLGESKAEGYLSHHAGFRADPFWVSEFILFESTLGRQGAHYTPIARFDLIDYSSLVDEFAEDEFTEHDFTDEDFVEEDRFRQPSFTPMVLP